MSNVFISYAKEDAATARMLSDALQRAGFSVWWDRHIPPGKTWDDVIGRSLDAAACVVVLWSKISVESRWVREEAERGASRGCLIPVLVQRVDPPFGFGRIEAADLSEWGGDDNDPEFASLRAAVSDLIKVAGSETLPAASRTMIPARQNTRSKLLWIAAGLMVVATVGLCIYVQQHPHAKLPNIVGLPSAKATQLLTSKGFNKILESRKVSAEVEPGTVIEQDPAAGTKLEADNFVRLVIATRPPPQHQPVAGQPPDYPLRCHGSAGMASAKGRNLIVEFSKGDRPADQALQPGQCSWLDRGLLRDEPNRIVDERLSIGEAQKTAEYINAGGTWTFWVLNAGTIFRVTASAKGMPKGKPV